MLSFLRRSGPKRPSAAICRALDDGGLPSWIARASLLRVVESRGRFSDRKVTFIRVFDPERAAERSLQVRRFSDLDAHEELVLRKGHIEDDGFVIMSRRPTDGDARSPVRTRAGRPVPTIEPVAASEDNQARAGEMS
jgi:hypothetical protein